MNINDLLSELFAMTFHAGIKPGLDRITQLCAMLDDPQLRYPVIHVAGTNGKGSTCAILASILREAGYKVGLYSSPHVRRFNERIRVNGTMISDEDIARMARPLMDLAKENGGTFFEVTTAMAFRHFADHRVDVAVIETGLGGRLDATNIVQPFVSVITRIDYDHMEYLGTTLTMIAGEKAGIIKEGAPAIIGPQDAGLRPVFARRAESVHTTCTFAEDTVLCELDTVHPDLTMTVSVTRDDDRRYYTTDLCGDHQTSNIATALAAVPAIRSVYFVEEDHVRDGLANVKANTGLLGRCDVITRDPLTVIDVAHNPGGLAALRTTLHSAGYADGTLQVVFGAMADKDVGGMLDAIAPMASTLHLCAPNIPRALPVEDLLNMAFSRGLTHAVAHSGVRHALAAAQASGPTLVCGSFHVLDEALAP